ncbi:GntR family transcriptional regulator [Streptomyces sp. NA02950]|uniref:GntR family transcriptional regulator n=1 Tax=Streptomyces sp. NA02950 TaxID=2742137 RepID=UPI0015927EA4|nr:GntR family transcriptional regulator [Streptomyces sp. NA02950]QKV94712.1 GntR family transcriptional regulator [Streptomyces sp. NA02950]
MPDDASSAQQLTSEPRYLQLARILAAEISKGEGGGYPPGSQLPSETELLERYGVSRNTVRQAIAELRRMGLAASHQGKGTFVRREDAPALVIKRTLIRRGKTLVMGHQFEVAEEPTVTRDHASGTVASLLGRGPVHTITAERLLRDPETGVRAAHKTVIPFDVADQVPALAERPDAHPPELYAMLADKGLTLTWWETVTARAARPDERAALSTDADTILITYRVTQDQDGRALLVEELRMSAAAINPTYRITPTTPARG